MAWTNLYVTKGQKITPAPFNELKAAGLERHLWTSYLPPDVQCGERVNAGLLLDLRAKIALSVNSNKWIWPTTGTSYKVWSTSTTDPAKNIYYQAFGAWNYRDSLAYGSLVTARALNETAKVLELLKYVLTAISQVDFYICLIGLVYMSCQKFYLTHFQPLKGA